MLALPFLRRDMPVLKGPRVLLRLPASDDFAAWARLRYESRAFLEPWEPLWASDEIERSGWRRRISRYREDIAQGTAYPFLIFDKSSKALLGGITLSGIRHGVSESGSIGYWMGERHAGRGYMVEAVRLVCQHAFSTLQLHRIEAACIPGNQRSSRVLEKAGFHREGLLRSYLRINGAWQDHVLYALIEGEPFFEAPAKE